MMSRCTYAYNELHEKGGGNIPRIEYSRFFFWREEKFGQQDGLTVGFRGAFAGRGAASPPLGPLVIAACTGSDAATSRSALTRVLFTPAAAAEGCWRLLRSARSRIVSACCFPTATSSSLPATNSAILAPRLLCVPLSRSTDVSVYPVLVCLHVCLTTLSSPPIFINRSHLADFFGLGGIFFLAPARAG